MSHIVNRLNKRQETDVRRSKGVCDVFGQTLSQATSHHVTLSKAVYLTYTRLLHPSAGVLHSLSSISFGFVLLTTSRMQITFHSAHTRSIPFHPWSDNIIFPILPKFYASFMCYFYLPYRKNAPTIVSQVC
jgi:hypothetical protein